MADVQKTVLIRHSAEQMFDLVTDVADYPNFLPWCGGVEIRRQDETGMEAKIDINFKGIKQHFATRNSMERPTRIDMEFADGPFRKFTGFWRFTPLRMLARSSSRCITNSPTSFSRKSSGRCSITSPIVLSNHS